MLELDLERPCEELYNFDKFLKKIPDGCTEDLRIHLNGGGGYAEEMYMYLDFFDRYEGNISLVCEYEINSADSLLFLISNTKKELAPGASCMLHLASNTHRSLEYFSTAQNNDFCKRRLELGNEFISSKLKPLLDENDFDFIMTGEDLILTGEKLKQVAARAENCFCKKCN